MLGIKEMLILMMGIRLDTDINNMYNVDIMLMLEKMISPTSQI